MANRYVATSGGTDHVDSGDSYDDPWATITYALTQIDEGDVLHLMMMADDAEFTQTTRLDLDDSDTAYDATITFVGANNNGEIDGTLAVIKASTLNDVAVFQIEEPYYILRNIKIYGSGDTNGADRGIILTSFPSGASGACAFINVWIDNMFKDGFYGHSGKTASQITYINCLSTNNRANGFWGENDHELKTAVAYSCVSKDNDDSGYYNFGLVLNSVAIGNTDHDSHDAFCCSGGLVVNCIAHNNVGGGVMFDYNSGVVINSLITKNGSYHTNCYGINADEGGSDTLTHAIISNAFFENGLTPTFGRDTHLIRLENNNIDLTAYPYLDTDNDNLGLDRDGVNLLSLINQSYPEQWQDIEEEDEFDAPGDIGALMHRKPSNIRLS